METKKLKIGINGFGRIGTVVLRAILMEKYDVEVAAINTRGELEWKPTPISLNTILSTVVFPVNHLLP